MSKDLIRLMHALFLPGAEACQDAPWRPNTDVYRTADGWLVKFELAGVRPDEIDLQALGGRLTLRGMRRDCVLEPSQKKGERPPVQYRMEISYSRFERSLELPLDLKRAEITTEYRDGLLLVRIAPRPDQEKEAR
jgi:HSP20 family protein